MKSICKASSSKGKEVKMTLKDYYENLPNSVSPKTSLVNTIAYECGVTSMTVHNWIDLKTMPRDENHLRIISRITGIPVENLF